MTNWKLYSLYVLTCVGTCCGAGVLGLLGRGVGGANLGLFRGGSLGELNALA
jgi:hypothetical protein